MERVAFLVEQTGERIACMLNPESLVMRRWSGVRPLRSVGGLAGANTMSDDPLLQTGGGTTELLVDLLFDVSLAEGPEPATDVRALTLPLWRLTEDVDPTQPGASVVRFVWGKTWNIRAVIAAIAERLESFDGEGAPGRSWLRMRMLRVDEPAAAEEPETLAPLAAPDAQMQVVEVPPTPEELGFSTDEELSPEAAEEEAAADTPPLRLDEIAFRFYGNAALWKLIAAFNSLTDPLHVPAGTALQLPPMRDLETRQ